MRTDLPEHPDLIVEANDTVWQGRFPLQRVRFRQRRFDGTLSGPRTWELWRRGRAAALLPYDPTSDQVVLIQQWRLPVLAAGLDPVMTEIPAGLCDGDEAPEKAIVRECREEAGLEVRRMLPIGEFVLSAGGSDETCRLYVGEVTAPAVGADGSAGSGGLATENEDIRVLVQPAAAAIEHAVSGGIGNSVAAIALLWLGLRRDWVRSQWT
ncbi:MAG: NUDIX domain-containing protein [Acidisphaera sp.]|nr:NUDIX domain-containing protein [Acidisphaera sp.]